MNNSLRFWFPSGCQDPTMNDYINRGYDEPKIGSHFGAYYLEHPRLGGTPLAMLAAQCNKLASKSPPPLADAAVGKGFHPWKKGAQPTSSPSAHPLASQRVTTLANSSAPSHLNYQRPTVTSACSSASYGGENLFYPGASVTSPQEGGQGSLIGKVHGDSSHLGTMYSRVAPHPYESWPFNMNVASGPHGPIKTEVSSVNSLNSSTWWDMHAASGAGSWLDMSGAASGLHSQLPTNYPTSDYGLGPSLAASNTAICYRPDSTCCRTPTNRCFHRLRVPQWVDPSHSVNPRCRTCHHHGHSDATAAGRPATVPTARRQSDWDRQGPPEEEEHPQLSHSGLRQSLR
ncbi:transcription factor Sp9 [Caerostris extrusa]|uniref:Transcription factor Sp9 n=1 Tax=Caerostris extrusa TaxID=172846 RepID=A0AAV4RDF1_CAEEX|nr:transcription factor Sp9 [Caerostris extrusa]